MPTSVYFTYTLIWIEKGFCVKGGPQTGTKIDQDFSIDTIVFFKPSMDGYLMYEGNAGKGALPWHGYDEAKGYLSP